MVILALSFLLKHGQRGWSVVKMFLPFTDRFQHDFKPKEGGGGNHLSNRSISLMIVRINLLFYLFFHRRPIQQCVFLSCTGKKHTTVRWDDGGKNCKLIN